MGFSRLHIAKRCLSRVELPLGHLPKARCHFDRRSVIFRSRIQAAPAGVHGVFYLRLLAGNDVPSPGR